MLTWLDEARGLGGEGKPATPSVPWVEWAARASARALDGDEEAGLAALVEALPGGGAYLAQQPRLGVARALAATSEDALPGLSSALLARFLEHVRV